jgi:uncharacterized membrane protein SirB2
VDYATLKLIHIGAVTVSFCGFVARGLGVFSGAAWVRHRLARSVPHLVDTILLLSAGAMLFVIRLAPWAVPWLQAKIVGLVIYVSLGLVALRPARGHDAVRPGAINVIAWIGALVVFGYIVSVALTKSPTGALMWLHASEAQHTNATFSESR